jgi:GT2 family glycosyltransferase
MSNLHKIALIIINYNNYSDTLACLKSLDKLSLKEISLEKIVIDNGSTNDSINQIKKEFPKINLIISKTNQGFASGVNLGIKKALLFGSTHILLLNNDTTVNDPKFLQKILSVNTDIVAPLVKFVRNGQTVTDYGGRVDYLFGRNTHLYQPGNTDYFSGVCLLIKSSVFDQIGFLNSKYFLYYEDVDFCLRARQANLTLSLAKNTSIHHLLSASTNQLGKKKLAILADSQLNFAKKHLPIYTIPFYHLYHFYLKLKSL